MSHLQSYTDIKAAVAAWLDHTELTDRIPDFITLAEADMRRTIRHDQGMCDRATLTVTNGAVVLPEDFGGVISLKGSVTLTFIPMALFDAYPSCGGNPLEYTLIGSKAYLYPAPEDGASLRLTYRIKPDVLRFGPNWLLENHPDLYIYGPLVHAAPYLLEDDRVPMWSAMYEKIKTDIEQDGIRLSSGGALQLTSNGPRW